MRRKDGSSVSLNDAAAAAVAKKNELFRHDHPRYVVRGVLAGAYLTLATGFAAVVGNAIDGVAPGVGSVAFAMLFGIGLFAIVILGAELATGNMMFFCYGAVRRQVGWPRTFLVIALTTLYNLIGVVAVAAVFAASAKLSGMDSTHLMYVLAEGKLEKPAGGILVEAIAANFVVNMGIVGALQAKDLVSKFFVIVPVIAVFVGLGLEHVIANFSLVVSVLLCADMPGSVFSAGPILTNWVMAWVGNILGGGFLIGGLYAWLNSGSESYRD